MILRIGIRIVTCGLLLLLLAVAVLLYQANDITESYLNRLVASRSATVGETQIAYAPDEGLVLHLSEYSEPGILCSDVVIKVPLLSLLNYKDSLAVQVNIDSLEFETPSSPASSSVSSIEELLQNAKKQLPEKLSKLVEQFETQPLHSLDIRVESLSIKRDETAQSMQLQAELIKDPTGNTMLRIHLQHEFGRVAIEVNHDLAFDALSVDFTALAKDWKRLYKQYLAQLKGAMSTGLDIYLDPLVSDHFFESSGYIRWNAKNPSLITAAVLGNVGAFEVYAGSYEFSTEPISFGLATNADTVFRFYFNVPIKTANLNGLAIHSGECSLKIDNSSALAIINLNDDTFKLSGNDSISLLSGNGALQFETELNRFTADVLRSAQLSSLPAELTFDGILAADGSFFISDFKPSDLFVKTTLSLDRLALPNNKLTASNLHANIQVDAQHLDNFLVDGTLRVEMIELAGVELSKLALTLKAPGAGRLVVNDLQISALGGSVQSDAITYDHNTRTSELIKIQLNAVDLSKLAAYVPQFDGDLEGAVSGKVKLQFTDETIQLIDGGLNLVEGSPANLSYSMNGLLTQGLKPNTAAHKQYSLAEKAFEDLSLKKFNLDFFPNDDRTKPIRLTLYGESKQGGILVPIDYTLNVNANDSDGLIQLLQRMQRGDLEFN